MKLVLVCVVLFVWGLVGIGAWPKNVTEIILDYGYPCEDHSAQTPDGYILSLQRIPHGKTNKKLSTPSGKKPVVFYQHGLTDCSVGINLNNPTESLPFLLANEGFDVWMGNNRGNGYSMKNIHFTTDDPEFWNFTWDQMASEDLPTQLSYVLKQTGVDKVSYVGHSEGTTQAWSGFLNTNTASMANIFIAMAPVAYVTHIRSLVVQALAHLDTATILELLGDHDFSLTEGIHKLIPGICKIDPSACDFVLNALMGPSHNLNTSRLDYYLNYEPNPTSVLNMVHWSQGVRNEKFQKFDSGEEGNLQHYGQKTPPQYDLSTFPKSLPFALFTGGNDYLADPADVANLVQQLPTRSVLTHFEPTYAHTDFLWAVDAHVKIYPLIIDLAKKYSGATEEQ